MLLTASAPRKAPAIHGVAPRSLYSATGEADAVTRALQMVRGVPAALPVVYRRRVVGIVQGRSFPDARVRYIPEKAWCGWSSYDDMITEITTNGKSYMGLWGKTPTSAGVANNWYDLWPVAGNPGAGDYAGTAYTSRQFDDTTAGSLYHKGNVSTDTKHVLAQWAVATANTPMLMLVDRVLAYDSCSFNASANQAFTTTLTAQRYAANGDRGLLVSCVVDTTTGATAANLTQLQYTDNDGNNTQSMPTGTTVTFIPSATQGSSTLGARVICPSTSGQTVPWGPVLPLAQGDTGVQKLANFTTSAANTGTMAFVLHRPLCEIVLPVAGIQNELDYVMQIPALERVYDGACLQFFSFQPATTAHTLYGGVRFGWG